MRYRLKYSHSKHAVSLAVFLLGCVVGETAERNQAWTCYTNTEEVTSVALDGDVVWFGTTGGVKLLNKVTGEWGKYTTADGLVDHYVNTVAVGERFVWFGTGRVESEGAKISPGGVSRYDKWTGEWINFTSKDGLLEDMIWALAVDGDDAWFGGLRGISRYDGKTGEWQTYTSKAHHVFHIAVDGNFTWFGSAIRGRPLDAWRYDKGIGEWVRFPQIGNVGSIVKDGRYLWFLYPNQRISRFDTSEQTWETIHFTGQRFHDETLTNITFRALDIDEETVWVLTNGVRLLALDKKTLKWSKPLSTAIIDSLDWRRTHGAMASEGDHLWIDNYVFDKKTTALQKNVSIDELPLYNNWISSLTLQNDRLWIDMGDRAAYLDIDSGQITPFSEKFGLGYPFLIGSNSLWFRDWQSDIQKRVVAEIRCQEAEEVVDTLKWVRFDDQRLWINSMEQVDEDVWIGTGHFEERRYRLVPDTTRNVLYQIFKITPDGISPERLHVPLDGQPVFSVIVDADDEVWVGVKTILIWKNEEGVDVYSSDGGVLVFHKGNKKWTHYTETDGLLTNSISDIVRDGNHIWVGCEPLYQGYWEGEGHWKAGGLCRLSEGEDRWTSFSPTADFDWSSVSSLAVDDRSVWVGFHQLSKEGEGAWAGGLRRFDKETRMWNRYTTEDGLANNDVLDVEVDDRFVWVATANGLSRIEKSFFIAGGQ